MRFQERFANLWALLRRALRGPLRRVPWDFPDEPTDESEAADEDDPRSAGR